jgi:hypothetical protein
LWLLSGLLLGLAHLARADALLMLLPAGYALARVGSGRARRLGLLLGGYGLVMAPWFARNIQQVGSPLNPGGAQVLWLLSYDELFSYPASLLTFERWWAAGLGAHLALRLSAAGTMLQRGLAENGLVFLAPFMLLGAVRHWRLLQVRIAIGYLVALLAGLTLAFPAIGARGAYFHASAAAMPVLWALAPAGVEAGTGWLGARRGWNVPQAVKTFSVAAVALAGTLTLFLLARRLPTQSGEGWGAGAAIFRAVAERLATEALEARPVAVNNPPGFFVETGRPSVVIPNGGVAVLEQVARRYQVGWVVLDANHPAGLADLYASPTQLDWLRPIGQWLDPAGRPVWLMAVEPGLP